MYTYKSVFNIRAFGNTYIYMNIIIVVYTYIWRDISPIAISGGGLQSALLDCYWLACG